jgi:hypothetical protein
MSLSRTASRDSQFHKSKHIDRLSSPCTHNPRNWLATARIVGIRRLTHGRVVGLSGSWPVGTHAEFPRNVASTIQLGNGDGTFKAPAYFGKYYGTPVFADLNGDVYLDIASLILNANAPPQVAEVAAPGVWTDLLPGLWFGHLFRPA